MRRLHAVLNCTCTIIARRNEMRQYLGAVNSFPQKRIIRHLVAFIPADLCRHEIIDAAFLHDLRKCCRITEYIRQPQDLVVHTEFLFEKSRAIEELTYQCLP